MMHFQASIPAPAHFGTLAIGGLLAVYWHKGKALTDRIKTILAVSASIGLVVLFLVFVAKTVNAPAWIELVGGDLGAGLVFVYIIGLAADGFNGLLG